jgi:hypothetical protein
VNPVTRGEAAQEAEAMETHEMQQDPQQAPIEQSTMEDAHARLIAATGVANTNPNAARTTRSETKQFLILKDALQLLLKKLHLPGESMSEEALMTLIEATVADLTGTTFIGAQRLAAKALDALTDEGLMARVETLVVLRPDAPSTRRQEQPSYEAITADDVRAELNNQFLAAGPGFSMDRSEAFARTNHALNCEECVHDPAQLETFVQLFDEVVDDLIQDGFLAQVISYVRLPDPAESEISSA